MNALIEHTRAFMQKFTGNVLETPLLLGISGGKDSMLLWKVLLEIGYKPILAHVNYGLRGEESDADEAFLRHEALQTNSTLLVLDAKSQLDQHPENNLQAAARQIRYAWFNELLGERPDAWLLTAHHLNDQVETFFLRSIRGGGLYSLSGMAEVSGKQLRPFLSMSDEQLNLAARAINLKWREDSSNAKPLYRRNQIRHEIIRKLNEIAPNALQNVGETCMRLKKEHQLLEYLLSQQGFIEPSPDKMGESINVEKLIRVPDPAILLHQLWGRFGLRMSVCEQIAANLTDPHPRHFVLRQVKAVQKDGYITVYQHVASVSAAQNNPVPEMEWTRFDYMPDNVADIPKTEAWFKAEILEQKCELRTWKHGDFIRLPGVQGRKKLSDYFTDSKLDVEKRSRCWLLCINDEVHWIVNQRLGGVYCANPSDRNVVRLRLLPVEAL